MLIAAFVDKHLRQGEKMYIFLFLKNDKFFLKQKKKIIKFFSSKKRKNNRLFLKK